MTSLATPPLEDQRLHTSSRKMPQSSKILGRASKRMSSSHEHNSVVLDGRQSRHTRVWKACERCRMKKIKCDGESPCKRCKDDGLVCTAGNRKKTEFKQPPRGYAEVLENTQYALIATVQKLYTMIRNNESWELGEPEMNDRGQPVIHDIASKLGCIRLSPDLPYAFPEGADDFAELQAQLQHARSEMGSEDSGCRHKAGSSVSSPALDRTYRASSSESEHSDLSKDYYQMIRAQQLQAAKNLPSVATPASKPAPMTVAKRPTFNDESYSVRTSFDTIASMPSPMYTDFQTEPPMLRDASPFSSWGAGDQFLGDPHALDFAAQYTKQQQYLGIPGPSPLSAQPLGIDVNALRAMQVNDGTIQPGMLAFPSYEMSVDPMMYEYESRVRMV